MGKLFLLLLIAVVAVSMCVHGEETVETYTETNYNNTTEEVVQETPIEDVCPDLEVLVEHLEQQRDNPYNKGTNYITLTLPEEVAETYSVIDNYEIIYPVGRKILCLKTSVIGDNYEFRCLDWYIKNVTVENGEEKLIEKKLNLILDIELKFEGFRNYIVSKKYLATECRDS